ncbi:hypothetical protein [Komagataeibacter europaeus]|uniref:hypothetical protein n=1 Tax=Komagataeibacter europaeus TaxID=33995 RepID=UPI001C70C727|nr:hypothetical protein [Komagataeibacter europaeus]
MPESINSSDICYGNIFSIFVIILNNDSEYSFPDQHTEHTHILPKPTGYYLHQSKDMKRAVNIMFCKGKARGHSASSADRSPFDKWKDGIDAAGRSPAQWNAWDSEIRRTVDECNRHLSNTPGYHPLDWRWIKAIIWVETGAHSPA